jgi:hypothetical protein
MLSAGDMPFHNARSEALLWMRRVRSAVSMRALLVSLGAVGVGHSLAAK